MKKLALSVLALLASGAMYALPIGNPSDPSLYRYGMWWCEPCYDPCDPCADWCDGFSMRFGFWGDYVFNRNLEFVKGGDTIADAQQATLFTNQGLVVLNFCEWLDVFGTVGATNFNLITSAEPLGGNAIESELTYRPAVSYSVGTRAMLWECDCFTVGAEAQWFGSNPEQNYFLDYATGDVTYLTPRRVFYSEWQVGFGASYRFDNGYGTAFVPYAGVKVSGVHWGQNGFSFNDGNTTYLLESLKNKKTWGYAVGITSTVCDMVGIGVEGRWGDEKAVYVNSQIRF